MKCNILSFVEKGTEMSEPAIVGRTSHDITRLDDFEYLPRAVSLFATICYIGYYALYQEQCD
jgi:hypothetical protein